MKQPRSQCANGRTEERGGWRHSQSCASPSGFAFRPRMALGARLGGYESCSHHPGKVTGNGVLPGTGDMWHATTKCAVLPTPQHWGCWLGTGPLPNCQEGQALMGGWDGVGMGLSEQTTRVTEGQSHQPKGPHVTQPGDEGHAGHYCWAAPPTNCIPREQGSWPGWVAE